jgi:uncharacterized membrane protein
MTPKLLILLLGALWLATGAMPVAATGAEPVTNRMCPVLPDEPIDPGISLDYQGTTVYFCCQRCRRQFEQNPGKYAAALSQLTLVSNHDRDHAEGGTTPEEHQHDHASDHTGDSVHGIDRLARFAGRFHPVVVHFPIALLLAGLAAEACYIVSRRTWFSNAARFSVLAGAVGAVIAALLGWANAAFTQYSGETANTLTWHRWLGVGTVIIAVAAAGLSEASRRKSTTALRRLYLAALIAAALLVGITGHFGGRLVFGPDYFTW